MFCFVVSVVIICFVFRSLHIFFSVWWFLFKMLMLKSPMTIFHHELSHIAEDQGYCFSKRQSSFSNKEGVLYVS